MRGRLSELAELLDLPAGVQPATVDGYLDLLGDAAQAGPSTGLTQRLMRTSALPLVYERYWRPALTRLAKGWSGPSMSDEHRFAREKLELGNGDIVLDVACGTGGFTRGFGAAVGPSGLAIGLDASRPMLARAVRDTPADAPVAYLRADAVRPPLRDAAVDAVCCFAALHMFAEPDVALGSFARVLKPGGRLALLTTVHRMPGPVRTVEAVAGRLTGQRMFDRLELRELLRASGFHGITAVYAGVIQLVAARRA